MIIPRLLLSPAPCAWDVRRRCTRRRTLCRGPTGPWRSPSLPLSPSAPEATGRQPSLISRTYPTSCFLSTLCHRQRRPTRVIWPSPAQSNYITHSTSFVTAALTDMNMYGDALRVSIGRTPMNCVMKTSLMSADATHME